MSLNNTMSMKPTRVEATIAGKKLTLETGQVARQAGGAVIATLGDTRCFAAATAGNARDDIDFFPLVCDYREKTEAAGKIPGGFFKREGRPTTKEILTMRLIDRSIRPMFAEGFKAEVQVMTSVMQYDGENNPDVVAMIAASAALAVSGVPFLGSIGAARVGVVDGEKVPKDVVDTLGDYRVISVNSVGEGGVLVCGENGDIASGDLIVASSLPGKGMKQAGFPSLTGQSQDYLKKQLMSFREASRANDNSGIMRNIAIKLSDAQIDELVKYMSSL